MGGRALVFILVMYIEMWTLQSNLDSKFINRCIHVVINFSRHVIVQVVV